MVLIIEENNKQEEDHIVEQLRSKGQSFWVLIMVYRFRKITELHANTVEISHQKALILHHKTGKRLIFEN